MMTASRCDIGSHGRGNDGTPASSDPVLRTSRTIVERVNNPDRTAVLFVKIDDFSKLCATSNSISSEAVYESLLGECKDLAPDEAKNFRIPRTGFLFLIDGVESEDNVESFAQRLVNATKTPFGVDGRHFNVSFSIGIALGSNGHVEGLVDRAQFAHDNAGDVEGSTYEFFDAEEARAVHDEVTLKTDLYTALEEDQFFLTYQPVVSLEDYSVCGAEALVRWEHPDRGLISPGEFIPLAEKTGQILFLDRWVLKNAIRRAAEWADRFERDLPIGINISAWQFRDNYLIEKIDEILGETGLAPSLVKIEITETSMMEDVERTAHVLRELKDIGVQIALDDFGTGHASFEYLSQFPIDELKIDRSFLDFDDVYAKNQQLVDIMIQTGRRVDTNILAEGIETPEQLTFLRNRGCEKAQGFLFAKPARPSEFCSLIEEDRQLYRRTAE